MGDFSANFRRPESGIHTVEGNLAGSRAATLTKKRQAEQMEFEARKSKIVANAERGARDISEKFSTTDAATQQERSFRAQTVGLVTAEEFKRATQQAAAGSGNNNNNNNTTTSDDNHKAAEEIQVSIEERKRLEKLERKAKKKKLKERKKAMATLSFAQDIEEEEGEEASSAPALPVVVVKKNPNVDTSFLPDKEREQAEAKERERLKREWIEEQEAIKKEKLEIVYSYWDGSGHRRSVVCFKGDTIGQFLELVRKDLAKEFREMGTVSSDALLYVKEDLILPQDLTFYDLISTKARGKSGPLFHFDVKEDIRVGAIDTRVEKEESHPGKVVERRWYERNKHIFPASRWEVYDPRKDYGSYTIHGGEVNKK